MIRKSFGLLALMVFLFGGLSYGAPMQRTPSIHKGMMKGNLPSHTQGRGRVHHLGIVEGKNGDFVVDTIQYCYDIGEPGRVVPLDYLDYTTTYDTVWWRFTPVADGTLMAFQGCFHTSGRCKVFVNHFARDTCYYLLESEPNLLPQELFWNVAGNDQIWQTLDFMAYPASFHVPISRDTSYVIGYRTDNTGYPFVNWDDPLTTPMRTTRPHDWRFSYSHATVNCDRNDPDWACLCYSQNPDDTIRTAWYYILYLSEPYSYPYLMLRAIVMYIPPINPFLDYLTQLMDTYETEVNIPVEARLRDLDGSVTSAKLYWRVKGVTDSVSMELSGGKTTYWTAVGNIAGTFSPGDTIEYWCWGWDNDGLKSIWNGGGNEVKSIVIREPNLNADIFLLDDHGLGAGKDFYTTILERLGESGYEYNYWSVDESNGFSKSILEYGSWNTAIIFGWGASTLPGKDYSGDSLWVPFLEGGTADTSRNILYIDQDYFCGHPDDYDCDFDSLLGPGEFLYDYFGVRSGFSETHDTLFYFMDHTTGDPFFGQELAIYPDSVNGASWTDFTRPRASAFPLFYAATGKDTCGVRYETPTFKTVFIPFLLDAAVDPETGDPTAKADSLIHNILRWFGTKPGAVREIPTGGELPKTFTLSQNYPNPFNPVTSIEYTVPKLAGVSLKVYNVLGQEVKTLVNLRQNPGRYRATWNGEDSHGRKVSSGIYFYQLKAGDVSLVRRMILLK